MLKQIAILQSSYIPWKGYFDIIKKVDEFVVYDIVQFSKNDFRNRNKLVLNGVPTWLTIPVRQKHLHQRIDETEIADGRWAKKHWRSIEQSYKKLAGFESYSEPLRQAYEALGDEKFLTNVNVRLLQTLCSLMRIDTPIRNAADFDLPEDRVERIIGLCKALGADSYLSGPAAKAYLDAEPLSASGIELEWIDYGGYPEYRQKGDVFEHGVSVIDLLFNVGGEFPRFMKSF